MRDKITRSLTDCSQTTYKSTYRFCFIFISLRVAWEKFLTSVTLHIIGRKKKNDTWTNGRIILLLPTNRLLQASVKFYFKNGTKNGLLWHLGWNFDEKVKLEHKIYIALYKNTKKDFLFYFKSRRNLLKWCKKYNYFGIKEFIQ